MLIANTELPGNATWVLDSLEGRPLIDAPFVELRVDGDWFIGFDGCNAYGARSEDGAPIADADGRFSVVYPGRTEMDCPEPEGVMDQADTYISALAQGERFRIVDDRLEIFDSGGTARLVFVKQPSLPGRPGDLVGTEWRLLPEGDGEAVRRATLVFLDDRLVTGATSCRNYVATYGASEGVAPAARRLSRRTDGRVPDRRPSQAAPSCDARWAVPHLQSNAMRCGDRSKGGASALNTTGQTPS